MKTRFTIFALVLALAAALVLPARRAAAQCPNTFNYALSFGGDQWVKVPNATSLNPTAQITVECWVKLGATPTVNMGLVSKWNDVQGMNKRAWLLWLVNGVPTFDISHNGVNYAGVSAAQRELPVGSWHHVAGTYDGSVLGIYVDGVLVGTAPTSGPIATNPTEALYIGLALAGGGQTAVWLNGSIDEVRVWNVARTPDQIWNFRIVRVSGGAGLVGAWNFDDIIGQTVADSTAGNNTGTLGNTASPEIFDPASVASGELIYPVGVEWPSPAQANATCIPAGNAFTLNLSIGFPGATSIQWFKDNVLLANGATGSGSTISGASGYFLTVSNVSAADAGQYFARVGGCGVWASNYRAVSVCAAATGACCSAASCAATSSAACTGTGKHFSGTGTVCNAPGNSTTPCCRADFNGSGAISVQDLFDFLAAWFGKQGAADFNASGNVTVQDLFDYLAAWFAGCP